MTDLFPNRTTHGICNLARRTIVLASLIAAAQSNQASAQVVFGANPTLAGKPARQPSAVHALSTADMNRPGLEKIAEITAMVRHNENCPDVPSTWSAAYLLLLVSHTPPEPMVEAKEKETLTLRNRIGGAKWCVLYRVEMGEAYLAARFAAGE